MAVLHVILSADALEGRTETKKKLARVFVHLAFLGLKSS